MCSCLQFILLSSATCPQTASGLSIKSQPVKWNENKSRARTRKRNHISKKEWSYSCAVVFVLHVLLTCFLLGVGREGFLFFRVLVLVIVLEMTGYEIYIVLQYNWKESRVAEFARDKDRVCICVCPHVRTCHIDVSLKATGQRKHNYMACLSLPPALSFSCSFTHTLSFFLFHSLSLSWLCSIIGLRNGLINLHRML